MLINIFGCPGSGKSTLALRLTGLLKSHGLDAEYAHEHIKTLIAVGDTSYNDLDILSNQYRLINSFYNSSEIVITDSPILNSSVYCRLSWLKESLTSISWDLHFQFPHKNVLLEPPERQKDYRESLRLHSHRDSLALQETFKNLVTYDYRFSLMGKGLSKVDEACNTIYSELCLN